MSQRQEEGREQAQAELYDKLDAESQPLRDRIAGLESEITDLKQQISAIYAPHKEFLTKL
jgi:predicted  nucleic acid-binding Zn-ribbon protein